MLKPGEKGRFLIPDWGKMGCRVFRATADEDGLALHKFPAQLRIVVLMSGEVVKPIVSEHKLP
jgi:hypothetical protein